MNLTSTSKLSTKALGNLALAGSLTLHVGLVVLFSSWQWNWTTAEKNSSNTVNVKFISTPSSSPSSKSLNSPKPQPMTPARPLTVQQTKKSHLEPRTPNPSMPTLPNAKMAQKMAQPQRKIIRHPLAQPTAFMTSQLVSTVKPANLQQRSQQIAIHRRRPTFEVRTSKTLDNSARTAISTVPPQLESAVIHPFPDPTQSISQVDFVSPPVAKQSISKSTAWSKFAALPREFPPNPSAAHDTPAADLSALRGLFTGKVRQRIANAKYYPRTARRRGMEGRPVIAFTLDKGGQLTKITLAQTSGYRLLDQAALEAVQRAAPYPEIPAELKTDILKFKLPISFALK